MFCQPRQRSGPETVRREEKFQMEKQMSNSMRFVGVVQKCFRSICVGLLLLAGSVLSAQNRPQGVKNIVLVHEAWADGSGWKGVYDILVKDGYNVSMVQERATSFQDDVAATKRVIAQQDAQCILVAHSCGGAVVTSERLPDSKPSPEELCSAAEARDQLVEGVRQLSPKLRRTFQLRDIDGLTTKEAALVLRVPHGTVKAQLARARATLARSAHLKPIRGRSRTVFTR